MAEGAPRDPSQVETSFTAGAMAASIVIGAILGGFIGASDAAKREEKPLVEPGARGARGARDTNPRRVPWALPGSTPGGFAPRFIASAP